MFYGFDPAAGEPDWGYDITQDGEQNSFHGDMLATQDLVIIGTDSGEGHVYGFEKATGDVRWKYPAGTGVATDIQVAEDKVYFVTLEETVICLDIETGAEVWGMQPPSDSSSDRIAMGSTPTLGNGHVYFGSALGDVFALDQENGEVVWSVQLGSEVVTSVVLRDDALLLGTSDASIYKLDAATGKSLGLLNLEMSPRGPLVVTPQSIYVLIADSAWGGSLLAFDDDLRIRWTTDPPDGSTWTVARPFVLGPRVLVGSSSGIVCAIDRATGTIDWSHPVDENRDWDGDGDGVRVFGYDEGTLFVGTISGTLYAFAFENETE